MVAIWKVWLYCFVIFALFLAVFAVSAVFFTAKFFAKDHKVFCQICNLLDVSLHFTSLRFVRDDKSEKTLSFCDPKTITKNSSFKIKWCCSFRNVFNRRRLYFFFIQYKFSVVGAKSIKYPLEDIKTSMKILWLLFGKFGCTAL